MRIGGTITSVKPARLGEDVPSQISANRSTRSVGTIAFGQKDGTPSTEIPSILSREFSMFNIIGLVPKASRWEVLFCGHCPNPHILFFDEENKPICDATITLDQIARFPDIGRKAKERSDAT